MNVSGREPKLGLIARVSAVMTCEPTELRETIVWIVELLAGSSASASMQINAVQIAHRCAFITGPPLSTEHYPYGRGVNLGLGGGSWCCGAGVFVGGSGVFVGGTGVGCGSATVGGGGGGEVGCAGCAGCAVGFGAGLRVGFGVGGGVGLGGASTVGISDSARLSCKSAASIHPIWPSGAVT